MRQFIYAPITMPPVYKVTFKHIKVSSMGVNYEKEFDGLINDYLMDSWEIIDSTSDNYGIHYILKKQEIDHRYNK